MGSHFYAVISNYFGDVTLGVKSVGRKVRDVLCVLCKSMCVEAGQEIVHLARGRILNEKSVCPEMTEKSGGGSVCVYLP
jgi:hypothetical protein